MGLKMGTVTLENHNEDWHQQFASEKENLKEIFGDYALAIEHIGSTSVEGLRAKPIIDIAVGVDKLSDFHEIESSFLPPYSIKEDSVEGEILVRKGNPENIGFLIHVMAISSDRYKDTILFRNYLKRHEEAKKEYQSLKEKLAIQYRDNRKMYTASKNDFIKRIISFAKEEKE